MNEEQLLAELYKRFQSGEITYDTFLAEQNRIGREAFFLRDFGKFEDYVTDYKQPVSFTTPSEPKITSDLQLSGLVNLSENTLPTTSSQKQPWETMSEAELKAYEESLPNIEVDNQKPLDWMYKNYAPNAQEGTRPQDMEELDKAWVEGRITKENYDLMKSELTTPKEEENKNMLLQDAFSQYLPFMNPYGTDIGTELYSLGKFIGTKPGTQGKGMGIASSALSAGLGGARTLLSGLAQQKQTEKTAEEIRRQLAQRQFTPQTQYLNQNNRGGSTES